MVFGVVGVVVVVVVVVVIEVSWLSFVGVLRCRHSRVLGVCGEWSSAELE